MKSVLQRFCNRTIKSPLNTEKRGRYAFALTGRLFGLGQKPRVALCLPWAMCGLPLQGADACEQGGAVLTLGYVRIALTGR